MKTYANFVLASIAIAMSLPALAYAEELVNPVQGAVVRYYNTSSELGPHNDLGGNTSIHERNFLQHLPKCLAGKIAPVETTVDDDVSYSTKLLAKKTINDYIGDGSGGRRIAVWDGYFKQSSGGAFTFTGQFTGTRNWASCFAIWVNGNQLTVDGRQAFSGTGGAVAFNVTLRAGFNHIRIAMEASGRDPLAISYKKADSIKPPKPLGPGQLWHEDEPDDDE